jgi:acetyl esterase/lipase
MLIAKLLACAPEEMLKQMPDKTFIMCGELDPLLDDSIFMAKRLSNVGKPVKLKIYEDLPHGFLNLGAVIVVNIITDTKLQVPTLGKDMWAGVKQVSEWMQEVFLN